MIADFTLQITSIPPSPLRVPVMLTSNLLVSAQVLYDPIKNALTHSGICVRFNLIIDGLVGHLYQPVLVPEWTST